MARSRHENVTSRFDCSAVGRVVRVTHKYLLHESDGRTDARVLSAFDCDGSSTCPVARRSGSLSTSFDWKKCVHPTMVESQRNR